MVAPALQEIARPRRLPSVLVGICVSLCFLVANPPARVGGAEPAADADVSILKAAGIPTDGAGLVAYIKERTTTGADQARLKTLVRQLGADEFKVREAASRQLVLLGVRARRYLLAAVKDSDPEIARRAQDCLERIVQGAMASAMSAAVRELGRRKPPDAAAVLLNYLPSAEDERVAETIQEVLPSLAVREGKPEPAYVEALTDKSALKRAAAAAALCRGAAAEALPSVRKLLDDHDPQVRSRVGLALAARGDKDAIPALIRSIEDVPLEHNGLVLELLDRLAAGSPPSGMPVSDQSARHKYRQVWETWWKEHQDKIEPAQLKNASHSLGYTLIVLLDRNTIALLDRAKETRWKIEKVPWALDVQLLPGEERVLIAEHQANLVSERNLKGEIVWKKTIEEPLAAQRLPNGHTFIATRTQLLEIDKDGKEVFTYSRPDGGNFMRAVKLRDGDIACVVQLGGALSRYVRLKPAGRDFREVKSWGVHVRTSGGRIDVLPNGHVLIPEKDNNRVVEYDAEGRTVWEAAIEQPVAAVRLPNGNTLVTSYTENRAVEVDRDGKEIWQFKSDSRVTRAIRR